MMPDEVGDTGTAAAASAAARADTPAPARKAIVVGTGFGGAVTACRLAQAGFEVELLERGRRYGLADFPALPKDGEMLPDARRWTWGGSHGLWDLRNLEGVSIAQAAGYGGGSLVYANVHLRPSREVFEDPAWPIDCQETGLGLNAGLGSFFNLVGYTLDVEPVPLAWRNSGKTAVMAHAFAEATVDENVFFPPLAIRYPAHPTAEAAALPPPVAEHRLPVNRYGKPQGECVRCGGCDFGCRYGAKNTLDRNYLAKAERTQKVFVKTLTEVVAIRNVGDGYRVDYKDHLTDGVGALEAPYVFLCAGAVNTTELLLRSIEGGGLHKPLRPDGSEPGQRYFFNADALAMVMDTEKVTTPSGGPVITTALIYQNDASSVRARSPMAPGRRSRFLIQDGGYPAAAEHLFSLFQTPLLLGRNRFDPSAHPPETLTAIRDAIAPPRPDRYPAFLAGMFSALRDGSLPNVLPPQFQEAAETMFDLAGRLRDDEIAELTEAVRDAVLYKSWLFDRLRSLHVDTRAPRLWRALYRFFRRAGGLDRARLLGTTLHVAHRRYGIADPKTLPNRIGRALMGERYPVDAPDNPFGRELPAPPAQDGARRAMLLAMGRDDLPAKLKLEGHRVVAEFEDAGFPTLTEEERVMRGIAESLGGTLRASPLWALARRPLSAHSHGGCPLGLVTDDWGEVRHNPNLFINDGALLPCPVGVNPSSTIAAVAERNIAKFVRRMQAPGLPLPWQDEIAAADAWADASSKRGVSLSPPNPKRVLLTHDPIGFAFREVMEGYLSPVKDGSYLHDSAAGHVPKARFLVPEQQGRGGAGTRFDVHARVPDIGAFLNDPRHTLMLDGTLTLPLPPDGDVQVVPVGSGTVNLLVEAGVRRRIMKYILPFEWRGARWRLEGIKEIEDDPGFDGWLDTSVLYTELHDGGAKPVARGVLRLGIKDFLDNQLKGLKANGTTDPARVIWTLGSFAVFFFGDLQGIYAPEIKRFQALFGSGWRALPPAQKNAPPTARLLRGL
jgi:choline dehydrogenase-like flavoprotein